MLDAHPIRPGVALLAVAVLGALLLEVWQCSTVASLSDQIGRATRQVQQANAELEWARAQLERESSRASLAPLASALGLKPADPQRIVQLPEEYLEPAETRAASAAAPFGALASRIVQSLVPDASARGRRVD
ncbi:MAG TPA: hypothetical protein VMH61_08540 [Candidatus Acidoferrales bacterium]|nr:hypothetical protein [Candidatus Acidoferrales bacterium]